MPLHKKTFQTRALTAALFVVVMLAGLTLSHWTFFLLFSIIHFGCWLEYTRLVAQIDKGYGEITTFHKWGVMMAGWCIMLYCTDSRYDIAGLQLQQLGWWAGLILVFMLPITELLFTKNIRLRNIGHSIFGLGYISLSLGLMIDLDSIRSADSGLEFFRPAWKEIGIYPVFLILAIWINDTMAYIVGSFIGRTPLSSISPKKTWEGTIGGIILSVATMSWLGTFVGITVWNGIIISALAAVVGTFGDLLESKLKRMAGVKDSGQIMPGHGGYLDRFDSMLLAIPAVWVFVRLILRH